MLLPTLIRELDIPQAAAVWPASAFSLVTASFLIPFGRFADIYGGYVVFMSGLVWMCIWSLIAGFSQNELMLDFCRALQGLGPAAFLPSGLGLIGSIYRPGPRKNLVFSLYAGSAPLGFFFGIFIAGLTGNFLRFGWYFWFGAILIFTTIVATHFFIPSDTCKRKDTAMDWIGAGLLVTGLILTVFAITDASHAPEKWATPYIPVTLILGAFLVALALYYERWHAKDPLIPFSIFKTPYLKLLFFALFFSDGVLGVFLLFATLYMQDIMGATPLQVVAWFVPMCLGGIIITVVGGFILHRLPGTVLVLIAGAGWCVSSVLFAVAPKGANYWAYVFPAMICATIGIDLTFAVTGIFISTSLSQSQQGLAGALINSLLYLGIAVLLGFADVTQTETAKYGLKRSYQSVFWYELACAAVALVGMAFVRIKKAESQKTVDEVAAEEKEERAAAHGEGSGGEQRDGMAMGRVRSG